MKNKCRDFCIMNIGILLLSAGVYFFKIPNGFSTGGVSGIGIILGNITPFSPAGWIFIINAALLIIGFIFLGKKTGAKTIYCSLMYSFITWIFERCIALQSPITDQPFFELTYAILLTAIGSALIFNCDASSGGTDIIALILKKFFNVSVGRAFLFVDLAIVVSSFFVFDVKTGLFSLLGLFSKAFLVDGVVDNLNSYKYFMVATTKEKEITEFIIKTLRHGATINTAIGAYNNEKKVMIHTVCRRTEAIYLRRAIFAIDPDAFIVITTSNEIIGHGFRTA